MNDVMTMLSEIRRPKLMMRAARIGAEDYRRSIHLPRLLDKGAVPRHGAALMKLIDMEAMLEAQRIGHDPAYRLVRHLDVLIAILGEAREYRAARP